MIVVKMIVPRMLIIVGLSLVHWSGGQHGSESYEPDRSALAMVLRRLCLRYSGNVSIWPGAGEVIQLVQASLWADCLASAGARIGENGAHVILSAGQPGVRGTVGASWRVSLR